MATESTPPRYPKVPQAPGQELDTKQVLQGTQEARLLLTTQLRDATGEMFNLKKKAKSKATGWSTGRGGEGTLQDTAASPLSKHDKRYHEERA